MSLVINNGVKGSSWFKINGNSHGWDHTGRVVMAAPIDEEGVFLATIDLAAQRAYRKTQAGQSLTQPQPIPEICGLYRDPDVWQERNVFNRIAAAFI